MITSQHNRTSHHASSPSAALRVLALACVLALLAAACGDDKKVGSDVDLSVSDQAEGLRLGETTTTTAAEVEGSDEGDGSLSVGETTTTTTAAAPTTTAPPQTTTTAPETPAITITINSDSSGSTQFQPSSARVFAGSLVAWTNNDRVARSVQFDDGSLNSGSIAPGDTYLYRAKSTGQFNYTDGTRPYAVGTLEVVAR